MVMQLSANDREQINVALQKAGMRTNAEIGVHVLPSSNHYAPYLLLDSFLIGSLVNCVMWWSHAVRDILGLTAIQIAVMLVLCSVPACRYLLLQLLPPAILHRHAARRAGLEYLEFLHNIPHERPVVLLFVSLAEHYVHVLHSRALHQDVDSLVWTQIVDQFTEDVPKAGLLPSCLKAIDKLTDILAGLYPKSPS